MSFLLKNGATTCLCLVLILTACHTSTSSPTQLPEPTLQLISTAEIAEVQPPPAASPTVSPTLEPSPTPGTQLCSPMQGIAWIDMLTMISNPFHPPPSGSDDPHQGVDFADMGPDRIALQGRVVQAVMAGQVVMVTSDRFPYGNALLLETPLEFLPASWLEAQKLPTPAPTLTTIPVLTCPTTEPLEYDTQKRSLYLLYAHMEAPAALVSGQEVACGQAIGTVGMSGNALNPHLHLEVRVGPSGIRMESMAHYDDSATVQEMANYCLWRVSGLFQLVDPIQLWSLVNP